MTSRVTQAEVRTLREGDQGTLVLTGHLGILQAPELLTASRSVTDLPRVQVDCAALTGVDASALQTLLALQIHCRGRAASFELVRVGNRVRSLLSRVGCADLLRVAEPSGEAG